MQPTCAPPITPRRGIPCPLLTWRPTPSPVQAQTGSKLFAKCKARPKGKGKRRHFITHLYVSAALSAIQHNSNKVCWSSQSDAKSKEWGKRPSMELWACFYHYHGVMGGTTTLTSSNFLCHFLWFVFGCSRRVQLDTEPEFVTVSETLPCLLSRLGSTHRPLTCCYRVSFHSSFPKG